VRPPNQSAPLLHEMSKRKSLGHKRGARPRLLRAGQLSRRVNRATLPR